MNNTSVWVTALALLSGTAFGQRPTTNDKSDLFDNTGSGSGAMSNTFSCSPPPQSNSAFGRYALYVSCGTDDTASGYDALAANTSGSQNTASGSGALQANTTGNANTASGSGALFANTTGNNNTASGSSALSNNTTGIDNTAAGFNALLYNTTGNYVTAVGEGALFANLTGGSNSAFGVNALSANISGYQLSAFGVNSIQNNTTGNNNTAMGYGALNGNISGSNNIAVGYQAGYYPTGSDNIDIGDAGAAADNGFIRIGTAGTHKATFIAGIYSSKLTGTPSQVYVLPNGRLGTIASSERYKTAIAPIGSDTAGLQELHPVKFHLKADPHGAVQYGLIAEEVAKVYPELVIRDANGRIDGVRYDELAPMLLNEMQKEHATVATLVAQHEVDAAKVASLEQQLVGIQTALAKLQPKDQLFAQR